MTGWLDGWQEQCAPTLRPDLKLIMHSMHTIMNAMDGLLYFIEGNAACA
jgi:hypothetical protein